MTVRAWLHSLFMTSVQFDDCESLAVFMSAVQFDDCESLAAQFIHVRSSV